MLLWRSTGGKRCRGLVEGDVLAGDRAEGGLALETALESWLPRSETAVASLLELTMKRVKRFWSAFSAWTKASLRLSAGPKYL